MRWTVALVAETETGQRVEHQVLSVVRDQQVAIEQLCRSSPYPANQHVLTLN